MECIDINPYTYSQISMKIQKKITFFVHQRREIGAKSFN